MTKKLENNFNNYCADRNSHRRFSVKKVVVRNFRKFTGKHLCQRLFFDKVADLRPEHLLHRTLPVAACDCTNWTLLLQYKTMKSVPVYKGMLEMIRK